MIGLLASVLIISCTKSFDEKTEQQTDFGNSTLAQVYIATVGATRNYVYVDGKPVTGTAMTLGSLFPSAAYSFNVQPGLRSFTVRDTLTTSTQLPLVFAENMQVGKNYTIFTYDTTTAPKQKTVLTNIVVPEDAITARVRFANFVYAPYALPAIDIYSARKGANIFSNIQVTEVTDYISVDAGLADTFYVRQAGTGVNLMNFTPATPAPGNQPTPIRSILTPTQKRSYTLVFRGGYRANITNQTTVRTLSVFANR